MPLSAKVDTITPLSIITSQEKARLPESVAGLFRLNPFLRCVIVLVMAGYGIPKRAGQPYGEETVWTETE